jgi:diguanylate cyclase (GGDEF)-like protein
VSLAPASHDAPTDAWLGDRARRGLRGLWLLLVVALVGYSLTTVPGARSHAGFNLIIDGWVQNGVLFTATLLIALRAGLVRDGRWAWAGIAAGLGCYALGSTLYYAVVQYQTSQPYPSVADAAWLTSYVFLYAGLIGLARPRIQISQRTLWLDATVGAFGVTSAAAIYFTFVLHHTLGSTAAVFTTMAYPVCDLVLLVVVIGTCGLLGWHPDRIWLYMGIAFVLFTGADTLYVIRVANDSYAAGTLMDPPWAIAAVLMAAAALRAPDAVRPTRPDGLSVLVVPTSLVLLALGLLVVGTEQQLPVASVVLASLTVLAGLLRAGITYRDVQTLAMHRSQARTDELTGLGNRRQFHESVGERVAALETEEQFAVLLLDLDRFKEVNDSLGHAVGDHLLVQVGERLAGHLRQQDVLVRLGGDEFAIMLDHAGADAAYGLAERLRASLQSAFMVGSDTVYIDVSIGIAVCPDVASDLGGLLQRADIAMYQAKAGRIGALVYQADEADLTAHLRFVEELRRAVVGDQLVLHYQPKTDLRTGQVDAVEALVRWEHPERGLLYPDTFISIAERYGFMRLLTTRVLSVALDQVRHWRATAGPSNVAVNVSASNLLDTDLPEQIAAMLDLRGLPGDALTVEITEGVLMVDTDRASLVLRGLRALGVLISIDDYGTGYSSLARLRDLPVTELKLDRSFIREIDRDARAAAIVESTVKLAHSLGLLIVAEGVETDGARVLLTEFGCDVGQGYHFGRAVPAQELTGGTAAVGVPAPRSAPRRVAQTE